MDVQRESEQLSRVTLAKNTAAEEINKHTRSISDIRKTELRLRALANELRKPSEQEKALQTLIAELHARTESIEVEKKSLYTMHADLVAKEKSLQTNVETHQHRIAQLQRELREAGTLLSVYNVRLHARIRVLL